VTLEHALSRSPEHGRVSVTLRPGPPGELLLVISDQGPSLSKEEQASLFDRDAWLEKNRKLSLGFRLSLAAGEARTMGGTLEVHSDQEGTQLELRLPVAVT